MDKRDTRGEFAEFIGDRVPFPENREEDDDDLPEGGVLVGWVVLADWQGTDGQRWLSRIAGSGSGGDLPRWVQKGMAQELIDWDAE